MKFKHLFLLLVGAGVVANAQAQDPQGQMLTAAVATTTANPVAANTTTTSTPANSPLTTPLAKQSYAIGVDVGRNFKSRGVDVDLSILLQGMKDGLTNGSTLMTDQEMQQTLLSLQKQVIAKRQAEISAMKVKNQQEGDAFLAANKLKPGVVTLPSGLQYKVIQPGTGVQPTDKDIVTVNYVGTSIDGKEFDSSYKRGKPVSFPLSEMIPGWVEALKLMKVGSTWEIYVPANLAYGEQGAPPFIGPNQVLIFNINLFDVKKPS